MYKSIEEGETIVIAVQKSFMPLVDCVGKLYLVATPIGNLDDMTFRAIKTLQKCHVIVAEDTRRTRKLLTHFSISPNKLFTYNEHNKRASGPELIRHMALGQSLALVSDAGLPVICDPGAELVKLALNENYPVIPIPGPNAALTALIASGMDAERFTFCGFFPRKKNKAQALFCSFQQFSGTLLFYESPHRIYKTLQCLLEIVGDQPVVLVRELTKQHEEWIRGTVLECIRLLEEYPPRGEYCILIQSQPSSVTTQDNTFCKTELKTQVSQYEKEGLTRKEAIKKTAINRNIRKKEVYRAML